MEREGHRRVGMAPGRLLTLADGIFAIAMTLLVLDLRLPETPGVDLATRLGSLIPRFGTFVVSFVVLGVFWFAHHQTFHFVVRVNRTLVWLSVLFFMGVALIPFVASVLGANYNDPIALTLYGGVIGLLTAGLRRLVVSDRGARARRRRARSRSGPQGQSMDRGRTIDRPRGHRTGVREFADLLAHLPRAPGSVHRLQSGR